MLKRTKYFIGGLLISLTVGAIAQTSGLPSRPRFLSVGVGTAAPSTNGNVNVSGSVTASNFVGNIGGVAPSDFARLSESNIFQDSQRIDAITRHIDLFPTGDPGGWVPLSIRDSSGADQWWLIANSSDGDLRIERVSGAGAFMFNGGLIDLHATSVQVNGNEVCRADGTGCSTDFARLSQSNTFTSSQNIASGANALNLRAGSSDHVYMSLFADTQAPNTRSAYFGFGGSGTNRLDIVNEMTGGIIDLQATEVQTNGVPITAKSGTFTLTLTNGCTTTPSVTARYAKMGNIVVLNWPSFPSCTSNSTFAILSGLPEELEPTQVQLAPNCLSSNNGGPVTVSACSVFLDQISVSNGPSIGNAFTTSGTKTVYASTLSYLIN